MRKYEKQNPESLKSGRVCIVSQSVIAFMNSLAILFDCYVCASIGLKNAWPGLGLRTVREVVHPAKVPGIEKAQRNVVFAF